MSINPHRSKNTARQARKTRVSRGLYVSIASAALTAVLILTGLTLTRSCCMTTAAGAGPLSRLTPTVEIYLALILDRPAIGEVDHLLITEVLYDPDGNQNGVEWIEIFNPTGEVIDLRGYKVGDEETPGGLEGMLLFPDGAEIGVGQSAVIAREAQAFKSAFGFTPDYEMVDTMEIVPDMLEYGAWAGGQVVLTNTGDEVLILDMSNGLVDAVSWGSSNWAFNPDVSAVPKGHSIERLPGYVDSDTAADWSDQPAPTPGKVDISPPTPTPTPGPSPTPFVGGLLVSEVLYDPDGPEPEAEWFELHNTTGHGIDITGFKVGDEETFGGSEGMALFPEGSWISAGELVVIANEAVQFESDYGWKPDFELKDTDPDVPNLIRYDYWSSGSLSLSNIGDDVLLLDSLDRLIDAVSWGSSAWAFDPPVGDAPPGHSIERFPAGTDTDAAGDWRDQEIPSPGQLPAP